ncbi:MAG TPA: response regulator [Opitutaceae bacterium]|jgi:CheY-like chemotaxis protein
MKILLADDEPISRDVAVAAIKSLGHEPIVVPDGQRAWEALESAEIRLVVSDWRMPQVDGLELCRKVRQRGGRYVYFILLTAAAPDDANMDETYAAGVDDFLTKPIRRKELKTRVHVAERILEFAHRVEQLETILPICSYCKKVRTDETHWAPVETYIQTRLGTEPSHGLCPECFESQMVPMLRSSGVPEATITELRAKERARAGKGY